MKFSPDDIDKLVVELGYSSTPLLAKYQLESDFSDAAIRTVTQLLGDLAEVDYMLSMALGKSRVIEADSVKLNPGANIRHLKSEGSRILGSISAIVGVCVFYDKYRPINRTSVKSYW